MKKAVIKLEVPEYQIGQEVSVYFKDTMKVNGICTEDKSTIEELEYLKANIRFHGFYNERIEDLIDKQIAALKCVN